MLQAGLNFLLECSIREMQYKQANKKIKNYAILINVLNFVFVFWLSQFIWFSDFIMSEIWYLSGKKLCIKDYGHLVLLCKVTR